MRYKIINRRKRYLVGAADALLAGLNLTGLIRSAPVRSLSEEAASIRRILIVRLAYIGDVILTLPVIAPLRAAFPSARIDLLTSRSAAGLLADYPGLNGVVAFDAPWFYADSGDSTVLLTRRIRREAYDLGIDFRADIRNIFHCLWRPGIPRRVSYTSGGGGRLLTHPIPWHEWKHKVRFHLDILRGAGIQAEYSDPVLKPSMHHRTSMRQLLDTLLPEKDIRPVAVHPGARLPLKRWPPDRFAEFIRAFRSVSDIPVILLGHTVDIPVTRMITQTVSGVIDLAGRLTLPELAAVLSECRLLLCHDSAPMHIAAAVGTPVVALFGPSLPLETRPCGTGHTVLEGSCPVKEKCDERSCSQSPKGRCLTSIPVAQVLESVLKVAGDSEENTGGVVV